VVLAHAAWSAPPAVLALTAASAALFLPGWLRLRRRGRRDLADWKRAALFALGLLVVLAGLISPIHTIGENHLLSVHMLQHVLVGDAAPALLVVALRGPLLVFVLPVRLGRLVARVERLPVWASLAAWAAAIGAWHVPAAYDGALANGTVHDLEHASFVAVGLLVWTQLVDPARRRRLSAAQRLAFAGCLFALGQLLSDVLFLAGPLYPAYPSSADQQLAGLVMMVEQTAALGLFAAVVLRKLVFTASSQPAAPLAATA